MLNCAAGAAFAKLPPSFQSPLSVKHSALLSEPVKNHLQLTGKLTLTYCSAFHFCDRLNVLALASKHCNGCDGMQAASPAQAAAQDAELVFQKKHRQQGQTSACWTLYCRNSGIMMQTNILVRSSSNLIAVEKSGGSAINAQMATCTAGLLRLTTEAMAQAAHSA